MKCSDITGVRFGRLVVICRKGESVAESGYAMPLWECLCDCGNTKVVRQQKLKGGQTRSCGCMRNELSKERASKLNLIEDEKKYILDRISINDKTGCWEWTGTYFFNGYARAGLRRFTQHAHRLSYIVFKGEIPEGILVCHKCDNPKCVNPDHLFLGNWQDNSEDMVNKGRSLQGEKHHKSKLKEPQVKEIRNSVESKILLSKKYGVSVCAINDIQKWRSWKHV